MAVAVAGPDGLIYGQEHHHGPAEEDSRAADHVHDEEDGGGRGEPDPHLQLDRNFALRYAKVICAELAERDPESGSNYGSNFNEHQARLAAPDEAIEAATATIPEEKRRLLPYHVSFGSFAQRYGYTVIGAIQPNDESQPSVQKMAEIVAQLLTEGVPAIFGSNLFSVDIDDKIASATGAAVDTLHDDGRHGGPEDADYTYDGVMVENMKTLAGLLGGDSSLIDGVEVGNAPDSE